MADEAGVKRGRPYEYTPEQYAEVVRLIGCGFSYRDVARRMEMTVTKVQRIVARDDGVQP